MSLTTTCNLAVVILWWAQYIRNVAQYLGFDSRFILILLLRIGHTKRPLIFFHAPLYQIIPTCITIINALYPKNSMFLLLLLASLPFGVLAAPTVVIVHPIRSQLPLIARVGSSYTWSISSSTFVVHNDDGHPISGAITYNVTGIPPWLSFSPTSLSFTGTVPSSASPGSLPITVTGSTGSSTTSISDTFDLLVSASKPPHVAIPLDQQLMDQNPALSGAFAVNPSSALPPFHSSSTPREGTSKAGIRLLPSSDFSIGLQGGTFAPWPLSYTASLMDGSPLPSWITYDPVTFTLDGTAPDSDNVPVSFEVAIAASDVNGYSAGPTARDSFWISVASHELKIKNGNAGISRNVSVGTGFVLDLMDGPNNDPWMGEVFWDSGFLSIDGVKDVSMVRLLSYF